MCEAFEKVLISHCAPTLARHKCGSLFTWRGCPGIPSSHCVAETDEALSHKGVRLCILKKSQQNCLVYVYRPLSLEERLADPEVRHFLNKLGYTGASLSEDIRFLAHKITYESEFPHEIGIFLDYPLHDVIGFIENRGNDYCCLGCWKAYSNEQEARKRFRLYEKCRQVYLACYQRGFDVVRLTVAAEHTPQIIH